MPQASEGNWMARATDLAGRKIYSPEALQAYALLAVAEALQRLAAAAERLAARDVAGTESSPWGGV